MNSVKYFHPKVRLKMCLHWGMKADMVESEQVKAEKRKLVAAKKTGKARNSKTLTPAQVNR